VATALRQILTTLAGRRLGLAVGGALVVNKDDGSQLVMDGTYVEALSRSIVAEDNGKTLEATASITLSFTAGTLPKDMSLLILIPNSANSVTLHGDGTVKFNGSTSDLVLAGTTASKWSVMALISATNSYLI
jgi:hypothetical protein